MLKIISEIANLQPNPGERKQLNDEGGGAVIETGKGACKLAQVFIELEDNKYE
jgi:hypothetical protein